MWVHLQHLALVALVANANCNHCHAQSDAQQDLSGRSQILQLIGEKERQTENKDANPILFSQLVPSISSRSRADQRLGRGFSGRTEVVASGRGTCTRGAGVAG